MPEEIEQHSAILLSLPDAEAVCALGSFNNWSTVANPLHKLGSHVWEFQLPFPGFDLDRLSFFVIRRGARYGSVIEYRDIKPLTKPCHSNESESTSESQSEVAGESC